MRIPVTGNGDVRSMAEARRMMAETCCQSVMIGCEAVGRPWVLSESVEALSPGAQVIARHCALIREHFTEKDVLVQMQKSLAWYTEGLGHVSDCRRLIFGARTAEEAWEVWERCWDAARPGPVDQPAVPEDAPLAAG